MRLRSHISANQESIGANESTVESSFFIIRTLNREYAAVDFCKEGEVPIQKVYFAEHSCNACRSKFN